MNACIFLVSTLAEPCPCFCYLFVSSVCGFLICFYTSVQFARLLLFVFAAGYSHERPGLRYSVAACTQGVMERALRLIRWRLVCIEEAWRQHNAHGFTRDSCKPHSSQPKARCMHAPACVHLHASACVGLIRRPQSFSAMTLLCCSAYAAPWRLERGELLPFKLPLAYWRANL